jgi:hypothetical protein
MHDLPNASLDPSEFSLVPPAADAWAHTAGQHGLMRTTNAAHFPLLLSLLQSDPQSTLVTVHAVGS